MRKKKTTRKKPVVNLFFDTFAGEFCEITTRLRAKSVIQTEETVTEKELPVIIQAYILDMDDSYYYLGSTSNQIDASLKIEDVVYVNVIELKNFHEAILDELEEPEGDEGYN